MSGEKSKKRIWDKLLMGAIIGGAIGSVVGASIAPKKGRETRKDIKKSTGKFFQKLKNLFKKPHISTIKKIPTENKNDQP